MREFIQGDGYPVLKRYNSSNVLQQTVNMPYVRDDGSNSYIKQTFEDYPSQDLLYHQLLDGSTNEDKPLGKIITVEIKYSNISADDLLVIYNCILTSQQTSGNYLQLTPRHDHNGTFKDYKVIFQGNTELESGNMFQHNVILKFRGTELVSSLQLQIPPVIVVPP